MAEPVQISEQTEATDHTRWVRICHWLVALSFFVLAYTGYVILQCHPRLYWGETGNDLTPSLIDLPITQQPEPPSWKPNLRFGRGENAPGSESRLSTIFNQNSWARSLHFLMAWILVLTGLTYVLMGIFSGHFRRNFLPCLAELSPRNLWRDVIDHLRLRIPEATGGPQYGLLQRLAYCSVVFMAFPLMVLTGLAMSPKVTSSIPFLGEMMGFQTARTIHFFATIALVLFLLVHLVMVVRSGFKTQIRSMTIGRRS